MSMYIKKGRRWEIMEQKVLEARKKEKSIPAIARKLGCAENFVRMVCKGNNV